jgi:DNA-binding FrmR family transcriptional regulator
MARTTEDTGMTPGEVSESARCSTKEMMTPELRADLLLRLRKAAGQVNGVAKMVESDRYCMDVLQQLDAAQKALEQVSKKVMRNYLERCVTDAMSGGDPLVYDELMRVIYRAR